MINLTWIASEFADIIAVLSVESLSCVGTSGVWRCDSTPYICTRCTSPCQLLEAIRDFIVVGVEDPLLLARLSVSSSPISSITGK